MQFAQIANSHAKFHLNQTQTNLFIAGNATQNTDRHEDSSFREFVRTYSVKLFLWLRL
jgi:hypothetical protein